MKEIWKKVRGLRRVEVSNLGNVRTRWLHKIKYLKPMIAKTKVGSYLRVSITPEDTGEQKEVLIHVLVANAFVKKPKDKDGRKLDVNHKDRDKHNNKSDNLEWLTRSKNLIHANQTEKP